jgi:signal transduction histidine kinase
VPDRAIPLRRLLLRESLVIVALAGLGLTFGAWWGTRRIMEDQAQAQAEEGLRQVAHRLEQSFSEARRTGDLLAQLAAQNPDPLSSLTSERQLLSHLQSRTSLCNITLVTQEGKSAAANAPDAGAPGIWLTRSGGELRRWSSSGELLSVTPDPAAPKDWRERPWYQLALREGHPAWTAPYPFLGSVGFGLTYAVPILTPQGELSGVAGIDLLLGDLGPWLKDGHPTPGTQVAVLDDQANILVPPDQDLIDRPERSRALLPQPLSSREHPLVNALTQALPPAAAPAWVRVKSGGQWYLARRHLLSVPSGPSWHLLMAIPEADLLQRPKRVALAAIAFSLGALLILSWRLRHAAMMLERPLTALAAEGTHLLDGKPLKIPPTRIAELQELSRCLRVASLSFGEREALESQLRQSQRLELVGTLAAGVAHDLGNLLNAVSASLELSQDPRLLPEKRTQALDRASQAMRRAKGFIRALLTLGLPTEQTLASLDLNQPVSTALRLLDPLLGSRITLHAELSSEDLRVMADPLELEQVVLNLGVNARDAMPEGGTLTVRTGRGPDRRPFLDVADTGTGIPESMKAKLFTAFVTTKGPDKGSGLGLAMVQGIAKAHGAELQVESQEGQGTRFILRFPTT